MDGVNSKVNKDDFEIDIVAEALDGCVEAYEVSATLRSTLLPDWKRTSPK